MQFLIPVLWLDLAGVAVFAVSGALVASRKQLDIVGFALLATVTGIGGGTLRDLLLDRPVGWISNPDYLIVCLMAAISAFFLAPALHRRFVILVWLDAAGMALFCVLGSFVALNAEVSPIVAIVLGVISATFGGIIRDVIGNELPLVLRKELYVTCAAAGSTIFVMLQLLEVSTMISQVSGFAAAFLLRAIGIHFKLSLPAYKNRAGREYPDEE